MQKRESQKHMLQSANELCVFEMQRRGEGKLKFLKWIEYTNDVIVEIDIIRITNTKYWPNMQKDRVALILLF